MHGGAGVTRRRRHRAEPDDDEPVTVTRPYLRPDAYVVLLYRSIDGAEEEEVWNSRDGVTPYTITLRSGRPAVHVNWTQGVPRPSYAPPPGSRVFVDLTEDIARENATAFVKRIWDDDGAEGMLARNQFATPADMVETMIADIQPGEPALVVVPKEGWPR